MTRQLNWMLALVAIMALALVSLSPFLTDGMPLTDDGNLHVYRSIVLDDAIRNDGNLYPRFAPALAYGYGASLFNYFPPTSYYPTVVFHALGLDWVSAWKATVIFYVILAGFGAWLWAKQWTNDTGAYIAAAAYLYAPYTLFDTVTRGSSNEFAGMALLPFALWGFTRLARYGKRTDYLLAIVSYALFIMAHNVMTLYGSMLLVVYCGFLILNSNNQWRSLWQLGSAGVFAVLLTAFFWLPALTETDFVKINGVLDALDFIDVTNTLRDLGDVFALPQTADPSQLQATVPISFHWVLVILGVAGFFLPQPATDNERPILGLHLLLFGVMAIVTFSQLTISADWWQSMRLLQYSQFAWRPMSIGSLVLAMLAGIGASYAVNLFRSQTSRLVLVVTTLVLIVLYAMPWLYRPEIRFAPATIQDAQRYEVQSRQPVLSSYGEYLPAQTLQSALDTERFLDTPNRLLPTDTVEVLSLEESGTSLSAEIDVSDPVTLTIDWLYVPGWRARVNGETVEVVAIGEAGLTGFEVNAGTHSIEIWYAGTRVQQGATLLSITAIFVITGVVMFMRMPVMTQPAHEDLALTLALTVIVTGIALFGIKSALIDQSNNIFRAARLQDGAIRGLDNPLNINFDNELALLGFDISEPVISGESTTITLYWRLTDMPIETDYSSLVQLVDSQGIIIAEGSNFYPGGLATSNWLPDTYIADEITVDIPPYTAPITYDLVVGAFHAETGQRLDIRDIASNPAGIDAIVSTLAIERPEAPFESLPQTILITPNASLYEVEDLPDSVQVGDEFTFSWVWQQRNPSDSTRPQLLWDDDGTNTFESLVVGYPNDEWQANDIWRGYQHTIVPPDLPAGSYTMQIRVGGQSAKLDQSIIVTVPERTFDLPELDVPLDMRWDNDLILRGYRLDDTTITFYWQTDSIIDNSLRLFVQYFDADGQLQRVLDGYPVDGTRPTTSWIPEEIVATSYTFDELAASEGYLLLGWYNERTSERVLIDQTGEDALEISYPLSE